MAGSFDGDVVGDGVYTVEATAVSECDRRPTCVGYWHREPDNTYRLLTSDSNIWRFSWAAGAPNDSVTFVKVKQQCQASVVNLSRSADGTTYSSKHMILSETLKCL